MRFRRKRFRPEGDIIHVCDSSPDGCGRIVSNGVDGPLRCLEMNHRHDPKYRGKIKYAPMMRRLGEPRWRQVAKAASISD